MASGGFSLHCSQQPEVFGASRRKQTLQVSSDHSMIVPFFAVIFGFSCPCCMGTLDFSKIGGFKNPNGLAPHWTSRLHVIRGAARVSVSRPCRLFSLPLRHFALPLREDGLRVRTNILRLSDADRVHPAADRVYPAADRVHPATGCIRRLNSAFSCQRPRKLLGPTYCHHGVVWEDELVVWIEE